MDTLFSDYTYDLNDIEKNVLIPSIVRAWKHKKIGEYVRGEAMQIALDKYAKEKGLVNKHKKPYNVHGARVRKMIHYIRFNMLVPNLMASQKGYYKTDKKEDILNFILSCEKRSGSLAATARAFRKYNNV